MGKAHGPTGKGDGQVHRRWFKDMGKKTGEAFKQVGRDIRNYSEVIRRVRGVLT